MKLDTYFSQSEKESINAAVAAAEKMTSAEVVPVLTDASGDYDRAEDMCGFLVAIIAVVACWLTLQKVSYDGAWASTQTPTIVYGLGYVLLTMVVGYVVGIVLASKVWFVRNLFTPRGFMAQCVERGARRAFHEFSLSKTAGATGILVYVSVFENMVYVLGDETISEKLENADFEDVRDAIVAGFKKGKGADGLCDGIRICGEKLSPLFPIKPDDVDELPNELRIYQQSL